MPVPSSPRELCHLALSPAALRRYRRTVLRPHRVRTRRAALRFIEALGFCYAFTGGPGGLPGLFDVLATRSIDRMWSWAWRWKDELATARRAYYGKVIRRKPSYVSMALLPAFYALSGNTGEPDDHLQAYREGRMSLLAKTLYEAILADGPVSTWTLRRRFVPRVAGSPSEGAGARFHRALDDLQGRFLVAKVAEEEEWRNGYIWDAFHRWMPEVVEQAEHLAAEAAASVIVERYVGIVGAASGEEIAATFGWSPRLASLAAARAGLQRGRVGSREVWATPRLWSA